MPRPMTITEKILAAHAGLPEVEPGQLVNCRLDIVLANDVTAPIAIKEFKKVGVDKVWDPAKIALVPDHYTPNKDIKSAEQAKMMRDFAKEQGISHYYEIGCMGVEHALLPEQGVVVPGDVIIGADSHTCTYGALGAFATGVGSTDAAAGMATGEAWFKVPSSIKFEVNGELKPGVSAKDIILHVIGMIGVDGALYQAMEFTGSTIEALDMDGRMTICNMAIEAGGKSGIIAVDDTTRAYLHDRAEREWVEYFSDADAEYAQVYEIDAAEIVPTVAFPHLPSNTRPAAESRDIWVDQVVIGSCTNGRLEDMRVTARDPEGPPRTPGRAAHHHPRHPEGVPRRDARGAVRRLPRCRRRGVDAHLRPVPGRAHGHPCGGGARRRDHEPQLRRPHGRPHQRGLSRLAGGRSRYRRCRTYRAAGGPRVADPAAWLAFSVSAHSAAPQRLRPSACGHRSSGGTCRTRQTPTRHIYIVYV